MTGIGHVYKIICTVEPTFCYIGSTFDVLWKRMGAHRCKYNRWIEDKLEKKCSCFPYFEKYGIENFKIVLIKSYEVCRDHGKDRRHLEAYETLWINRHKGKCCNQVLPIGYLKKVRIAEYQKEYGQLNKATLTEYHKGYYQKNKATLAENQKEYREENKVRIREQRKDKDKERYLQNKEQLTEKVQCECGCVVARRGLTQHRKTKKHIQLMASK
jgi:hypothetical protein